MMSPTAFDGAHLLADLHGCTGLDDPQRVERALRAAVEGAGATLLALHIHHFGKYHGVTGVALLAESHISIHTWPERDYAAVDIFLCSVPAALDMALAQLSAVLTATHCEAKVMTRGYSSKSL